MNRITQIIIHPVLLALYPVLFIYSHNIGQVYIKETILPILTIILPVIIGWLLIAKLLKDIHRSALIVSIFIILFFTYGQVAQRMSIRWRGIFLLFLWGELFLISSYIVIRSKCSFRRMSNVLNLIALILVVLCGFKIVSHKISTALLSDASDNTDLMVVSKLPDSNEVEFNRDIYFIVLDAYGSAGVLREMYDYDNSEFLNVLRAKGFYVAGNAVSNYCQTGLSLGSCLNLSYLDDFIDKVGPQNESRFPLKSLIEKSLFVGFLREKGYRIVAFDTYGSLTNFDSADLHLSRGDSLSPFCEALKDMTPLRYFAKKKSASKYRENILFILDSLSRLPELSDKPKFVFSHIELPHPPFVFGPNGEPVRYETSFSDHDGNWLIRPGRLTRSRYIEGYVNQVAFLNDRIKLVIDDIISKSTLKPIILLVGDHGPRSQLVWDDPCKSNVKEAHSILSAFYLPDYENTLLYPQISLVNILRVISNAYFQEDYTLLLDKCFFSTAKYPYTLYDVTDRMTEEW